MSPDPPHRPVLPDVPGHVDGRRDPAARPGPDRRPHGEGGLRRAGLLARGDAPAHPVGDPRLRGRPRRAGRPRLHADRDRGPADLPLRPRLAAGRAGRRPARRRLPVPRGDRGLRHLSARGARAARRRAAHRRRGLGRARAGGGDRDPGRGAVRARPRAPGAQDRRPPHAGADRHRRGGGAARPAPAAVRGDRPGARAGPRPAAAAQRRRGLRRGPGRPRACRSSCCAGSRCWPGRPACWGRSPRSAGGRSACRPTWPWTATPSTSTRPTAEAPCAPPCWTTPGEAPVVRDHPDPVERPGHTLVRVTAAPIVPLDQLVASGTSYFGRPATPYVPGTQGVGVVERSAVLPAGTRVFVVTTAGMAPATAASPSVPGPGRGVVPWPPACPTRRPRPSGCPPSPPGRSSPSRGRLQPGGAGARPRGGRGGRPGRRRAAAKCSGAGRVVAACRSAEAQERARRAGADAVVPLEGDVDALTARFQDACGGSVDVVVDPVFGDRRDGGLPGAGRPRPAGEPRGRLR